MEKVIQVSFRAEDLKHLLAAQECEGVVIKLVYRTPEDIDTGKMEIVASSLLPGHTDPKTSKPKTNLAARSMSSVTVSGCPYPPGCNPKPGDR